MNNFNDFDLDVKNVGENLEEDDRITSMSLCTPGCKTGVLHCGVSNTLKTVVCSATCGCQF